MKHLLIILFLFLLLSSPVFGQETDVLYQYENFFWNTGDMEYVGEYKDGKKHGQGTYTWFDGGIYVGKWKDGKEHGQGTYTSHVGTKYVGEWKDGMRSGQGTENLV